MKFDSITWFQPDTGNNLAFILNNFSKFCNLSKCDSFEERLNEPCRVSPQTQTLNVSLLHFATMFTMQASCIMNNEVVSKASRSLGLGKLMGHTSMNCFSSLSLIGIEKCVTMINNFEIFTCLDRVLRSCGKHKCSYSSVIHRQSFERIHEL